MEWFFLGAGPIYHPMASLFLSHLQVSPWDFWYFKGILECKPKAVGYGFFWFVPKYLKVQAVFKTSGLQKSTMQAVILHSRKKVLNPAPSDLTTFCLQLLFGRRHPCFDPDLLLCRIKVVRSYLEENKKKIKWTWSLAFPSSNKNKETIGWPNLT